MFSHLNQIDILIIFAYLISCLVIGYNKANKISSLTEYAVGTRSTTTFALMTAVFATRIGAGATIGEIERVFTLGIIFALSLMVLPLSWFLSSAIFSKNIDKFRDCISLTDIMRKLYGKPGQWFTVFASLIDSLGSISAQLSAIGFLFQYVLDVPNEWGVITAGILVCTYVFFGGAKSVILTDVFQFLVFYAAMPIACVIAVKSAGGLEGVVAKLPPELLTLDFSGNKKWLFFSFCFYAMLPPISATFIQRYLMAKNSNELSQSLNSIALITFPFAIILCVMGFTIKSMAPDVEPNTAFYHLVITYLPSGAVGITIAAVFAIIMSSANSWLNSGSTIVANDIARSIYPNMSEKQGLYCARIATIVITLLSIGIAIIGGNIIKILWFTDSYWFPVMFVPIVAGMLGFKISSKSFVASSSSAIIIVSIIALVYGEYNTASICLGIITSFAIFFLHHYFFSACKANIRRCINNTVTNLQKFVNTLTNFRYFRSSQETNNSATSKNFTIFCIFIIYQYIPSMFDTAFSSRADFTSLILLKISVLVFAFLLVLVQTLGMMKKKTVSNLWKFNIFYALSFIPSLMLIVNTQKTIWVINLLLCLGMQIAFLTIKQSLKLWIIGSALAFAISPLIAVRPMTIDTISLLHSAVPIGYGIIGIMLILIAKKIIDRREEIYSSQASYVAHEAINPLAVANMTAQSLDMLISKINSENKKTKTISISKSDWGQLSDLSQQLSVSSINGVKRVNNVLSSLNKAYDDVGCYQIYDVTNEIDKEFINYKNRITMDLKTNFIFYGSKEGLKTVISNLIRNALKHSGKNSKIIISTLPDSKITVQDDGIGINSDVINQIFDLKFTSGGHGYGLSLCKQIVEDHGGSLICMSIPNEKTVFTVQL